MEDSLVVGMPLILADVSVRYLSCGDTAFSVEFGNEISPQINGQVMALHAAIGQAKADGELTGAGRDRAHHALADGLLRPAGDVTRAELEPQIDALIARGLATGMQAGEVRIPCCYDDPEFAPDLAEVAERTKKTPEQVIAAHLASALQGLRAGLHAGPRLHRRPRAVALPAAPHPAARAPAALDRSRSPWT